MKSKILLTLFLQLLLMGCKKEEVTFYYAYLKNKSTHQIQIKPYSLGAVVSANIISLTPNQEIKISDDGSIRGISQNSGFGSKYFSGVDSLIVTFDGLYSITHYFINPTSPVPKHYLYTSNRNLGNKYSYLLVGQDSKYTRTNSYYYDFTEQDFMDAQ